MSWDVSLCKFTRIYKTIEEIPDDERPLALSTLVEVLAAVSEVFPGTAWKNPRWGINESEFGSVEFNVGRRDPVQNITLHVRASDAIVGGILHLCKRIDCQAMDLANGSFLDQSESPSAGLEKWREYHDRTIGK